MKKVIDKKLILFLSLFYAIIELMTFLKRVYFDFDTRNLGIAVKDWVGRIFLITCLDWIIVTLYMVLISVFTKKMIAKEINHIYLFIYHFFFALAMGWVINIVGTAIVLILGIINFNEALYAVSLDHYLLYLDMNFIVYFVMAGVIYVFYYLKKIKEIENQKTILNKQLIQTKITVLKYQLHPHFFFNTLNSIATLIETNPKLAQNTLVDLSDLYRDILQFDNSNTTPIYNELKLIKKYISLMSIRFSDHLNVKIDIEDNLHNALLPTMLLQPLVENSFKHGYSDKNPNLTIVLSIRKIKNNLEIIIKDNGKSFNSLTKKGKGLSITRNRLKMLYGNKFKFKLSNDDVSGVSTRIVIPYAE